MAFGGILTAMVTPFDENGGLAEDAAASLIRHCLAHGSDGVVLAGTTGESATLTDDERERLWQIGTEVSGDAPVIAGTGSASTEHTIELTARAAGAGADAALVVTPYYCRPSRAGILAHYRAVANAAELPIVLYNIPQRTGTDMPNDLLAELARIDGIVGVKQARYEDLEPIDGLALLAGNDDMLARVLDMGGPGGILVASQLAGEEMARMVADSSDRARIHRSLEPLFKALSVAPAAVSTKAALRMLGHDVGGVRLPYVDADESEQAQIRAGLEAVGILERV